MTLFALTVASLLGSLISLLGGILLLHKRVKREKIMLYAMPFGAGALLGAAFFDVLPEALHEVHELGGTEQTILTWALIGFVLFFVMERTVRWFHRHHEHGEQRSHKTLIVLGDTIHNAIDGVAIGAAFLVSIPTGIVTTLAVAAHELPQEIGDFGMLLGKGMLPRKVLVINILSSLATLVTALLTFWLGASLEALVPLLLAVVAGCFIYIAAADIIPDIHEQPHRQANLQSMFLLIGIATIPLVGLLLESGFGIGH
ncbi:MAG TPA: ZIP family metal transporter [Candidatus Saccharimonadales bacterium]